MYEAVVALPASQKGGFPCPPDVLSVPFPEGYYAGRRNGSYPPRGALPCSDRLLVVHGDCSVVFDNSAPAVAHLPFQSIAGQILVKSSLPGIAPEILLASGTLASLNACRHGFQLIPCLGGLGIPVSPQQIRTIEQDTNVGVVRYGQDLTVCRKARHYGWILCGKLRSKGWLQIRQVLTQYA